MKRYLLEVLEEINQKLVCEDPNQSITFGWLMNCIEEIQKSEIIMEKKNDNSIKK